MVTHNYTLICDDFRMEVTGKFIIIGLFPNGLSTPQLPFPLPTLTFFQSLSTDAVGTFKFKGTLRQLDNGTVLATAEGAMFAHMIAPIILPIKLQNLRFMSFGSYTWSLEIEGQEEPFLTEFTVVHAPPPQVRTLNAMPGR
jgi:hypothetical protein